MTIVFDTNDYAKMCKALQIYLRALAIAHSQADKFSSYYCPERPGTAVGQSNLFRKYLILI